MHLSCTVPVACLPLYDILTRRPQKGLSLLRDPIKPTGRATMSCVSPLLVTPQAPRAATYHVAWPIALTFVSGSVRSAVVVVLSPFTEGTMTPAVVPMLSTGAAETLMRRVHMMAIKVRRGDILIGWWGLVVDFRGASRSDFEERRWLEEVVLKIDLKIALRIVLRVVLRWLILESGCSLRLEKERIWRVKMAIFIAVGWG